MKTIFYSLITLLVLGACTQNLKYEREQNFNKGWKFTLENVNEPYLVGFDDSDWRSLDLPHDWSAEFEFDKENAEGCTAYLHGGLGWYRKTFDLNLVSDQKTYILFDGVYNNSEVWLNGIKLGEHPYGYSPFYFDLTPYLNENGIDNEIVVKVDHTRFADSRWYSGSGIYRNVKLITTNTLHIPVWGTFITTPEVKTDWATVRVNIEVANESGTEKNFEVECDILDADGKSVGVATTKEFLRKGSKEVELFLKVDHPKLWSVDSPTLYTAVSKVIEGGKTIDQVETRFGIRTLKFDPKEGFFLNGENMKIKGVCLHHDGGLVGAAVPKGVWKRRLQTLKDGGCNAIRISHNPASVEFLELCDEMGFLVQDEFFDEWDYPKDKRLNMWEQHDDYITRGYTEYFQDWAEQDLKSTMLAHRNHPSIIQWSIGNEIEWTYPRNRKATGFFNNMDWSGNYFWSQPPYSPERIKNEYESLPALEYEVGTTAQKLANWTREMDVTRPVVANCILPSASFETGYADALDVVGFSYRRVMYDYAKEHYPNKVVMGTENVPQWHEWKAIVERPFVSGTFLWTGIDYMGEANNRGDKKGIDSGLLDLAGFKKQSWHMYKTLWCEEEHIALFTQTADKSVYKEVGNKVVEKKEGAWKHYLWFWYDTNEHWNYTKGEKVIVEVISGCEEVELFLNNRSLGIKKLSSFPDRIYKWAVPFEKGELKAIGRSSDCSVAKSMHTSGKPASIQLVVDHNVLGYNSDDVAHVVAQVVDANGIPVKDQEFTLDFEVVGNLKVLGVDNGSITSLQKYQSNTITTSEGRALLIVQENDHNTQAKIIAVAEKLSSNDIHIDVK